MGDRVLFGTPGWRDVAISDAIAASSALPLYFQPVTIKGLDFVDGGVASVAHLDIANERGSRFLAMSRCATRSEEHTSELQSLAYLVCRLLLEKKKKQTSNTLCRDRREPSRHSREQPY